MIQNEIRLEEKKWYYIGLWPLLLILIGVLLGLCIAMYAGAGTTTIQTLTDLLRDKPQVIAEHMVKSSEAKTDLGDAYDLVIADLEAIAGKIRLVESRAFLTESDKLTIKAADEAAVFDVKDIPDIKK